MAISMPRPEDLKENNTKYFVFETTAHTLKGIYDLEWQALESMPRDGYYEVRKGQWKHGPLPEWHTMEKVK